MEIGERVILEGGKLGVVVAVEGEMVLVQWTDELEFHESEVVSADSVEV